MKDKTREEKHLYRIGLVIEDYNIDLGFWNVYYPMEAAKNKKQLKESLKKFFDDCNKYIDERFE